MSFCKKKPVSLVDCVRKLRGGSQPVLAQANDGHFYVVKFSNNPQGPNLAFNESMGSELYRLGRISSPSWRPIHVSATFIDKNPDCWIETAGEKLRPNEGICFGSRFLQAQDCRLIEILPGRSFDRIRNRSDFWLAWLLDILAGHVDNRQAIFREKSNAILDAFFIDHGHMFGGPKGEQRAHFKAPRYLDGRAYPDVSSKLLPSLRASVLSLNTDSLWKCARALPDDWKMVSAFDRFAEAIEAMSKVHLIDSAIEAMLASHVRTGEIEVDGYQFGRSPKRSVLRLGIPGAGQCGPVIN